VLCHKLIYKVEGERIMKRIIAWLLTLVLVFSLAACGKEKTEDERNEDNAFQTEENNNGENFGEDEGSNTPNDNENEYDPPADDGDSDQKDPPQGGTAVTRFCEAEKARFHACEENGYSIWYGNNDILFCVDYFGYKTVTFDEGEEDLTNVYNGVVLTRALNAFRLRHAADGSVLYTTENTPNVNIMVPYYNANAFFKDGFVFAYTKNETYNGTTYEIGFLSCNGQWIVPLSSDNPMLKIIGDKANLDYFERSLVYSGEGIIAFCIDNTYYLYSIPKNEVHQVTATSDFTKSDIDGVVGCGVAFKKGYATGFHNWSSRYYKLAADGTLRDIPLNFPKDLGSRLGSEYYDAQNDRVIIITYSSGDHTLSVLDSKGTVIKTLTDVTVSNTNGFGEDGLAQIVFTNQDDTKFYTVMDITGTFQFNPISLSVNEIYDLRGNHIECVKTYSVNQGQYAVVDENGTVILETDHVYEFAVENGVAGYKNDFSGNRIYKPLA